MFQQVTIYVGYVSAYGLQKVNSHEYYSTCCCERKILRVGCRSTSLMVCEYNLPFSSWEFSLSPKHLWNSSISSRLPLSSSTSMNEGFSWLLHISRLLTDRFHVYPHSCHGWSCNW
uniref:Uncharacterized protein n=1 Tax=Triticum urartu TaxID=4572 RepID=A0A8R7PIL9_TRIUA